jgi:pimeloyl-ACP methyl ester carboxylesterase
MPDARVQAAIAHWAPRFVLHGVDFNDFQRTTERVESWDGWLDAWSELAEDHLLRGREAEAAGHGLTAGDAYLRAAVAFHFGKFVWVLDWDRHREATDRSIAALADAHRLLDPTAERVEAPLEGASVAANLRRPARVERAPLVVLIAGLDSTKEEFFHLEEVFLRRGMATLSLDGPGQGETGFVLPIRPDYEVALSAALDAVAGRADLDQERIGAVGVSLGGYYAPRAAAFEPRVKAVVGISGPFDFSECWEGLPPLTRETFQRKSFAADEAEARALAAELTLEGVVERIAQPALMVTGRQDRLIPWEQTERIARGAPRGEWVLFDDGNHGVADVGYKSRPLVADWIADRLGARAGDPAPAGAAAGA